MSQDTGNVTCVMPQRSTFLDNHGHQKHKDSLEGNLIPVLFGAELEFSKILVSRLPQYISNVNIESTKRLKQM